jgi:hypothetical protein
MSRPYSSLTHYALLVSAILFLAHIMWSAPSVYALGCSTPSFGTATTFSIPSNVYGVALGDFNRDGKIDAATANKNINSASVILGNGAGGFGSPTNYAVGNGPTSIATADFNLDGKLDLVTANDSGNSFSILLGDGAGLFTVTTTPLSESARPWLIAAADMTNDGIPDVVIRGVNPPSLVGRLFVYEGTGTGSFIFRYVTDAPDSYGHALAVGDFNEDGRLDIVTTCVACAGGVRILRNDGSGQFTAGPSYPAGNAPVFTAIGDFNNDGKLDLAAVNNVSGNFGRVSVLLGNGVGGFGSPTAYDLAGNNPNSIAVGDYSANGISDLAVAVSLPGFNNGSASVLLGNGAGSFATAQNTDFVRAPTSIATADLNGDGRLDLVTGDLGPGFGGGTVTVMLNTCSEVPVRHNKIADFDGDGRTDISVYRSPGEWYEMRSSNNTFYTRPGFGMSGDKLVPGDFDGDHKSDIAVFRGGTGEWFAIDSSTGLANIRRWGAAGDIPVVGDFDGDGKSDLAVFRPGDGAWYIRRSADLTLRVQSWGASTDKPVSGDFDGDGKADIAVFRPSEGAWYILLSSDGSFKSQAWGLSTDKTVPGDYDGDGKTDIAVFRPSAGAWYVLRSSDNAIGAQAWGSNTDVPVPGDYDGDGKTDFAVYRQGVWYILNSSNMTIQVGYFGLSDDVPLASSYSSN